MRRNFARAVVVLGLALLSAGCPTTFRGNAHVENGKAGCQQKCRSSGLQFTGMVFLGEYSSACVCELPRAAKAPPAAAPASAPPAPSSGGDASPTPPAAPASDGPSASAAATAAAVAAIAQPTDPDDTLTPFQLSQ